VLSLLVDGDRVDFLFGHEQEAVFEQGIRWEIHEFLLVLQQYLDWSTGKLGIECGGKRALWELSCWHLVGSDFVSVSKVVFCGSFEHFFFLSVRFVF
jgi:hypothetical protein